MRAGPAPAATAPRTGLRRFTGPRPPVAEHCDLCAVEVGDGHRHLVDTERRTLVCACQACAMLFDRDGAGGGRFRTVPARFLTDPGALLDEGGWAALQIPVGIVFFLRNSALDRVVAFYPGPGGATESEVDPELWQSVVGGSPLARTLLPDVEALLVRHTDQETACYLVPVDVAYELVGRMRMRWQGFDGGSEVRAELAAFFAELADRARPVPDDARTGRERP